MSKFQTDKIIRIYDDRFGDMWYEVCMDSDTGQAVEIRSVTVCADQSDNQVTKIQNRVAFDPDMIPELIEVLNSFRKV